MRSNIKKDFIWNTLGVFLQNAISPLLLVVITRLNGIYDSGLFSFAFSVAIIFWAFGMWGGRTYQVSDVTHEFSHRSYIMVRLVLGVTMIFGAIIFAMVNHYDAYKSGIIIALVVFKAVESIADALHGVLQVHNRLFIVGKSLLYKAVGGFGLFVIIDMLTGDILLSSLGIVVVNILFFLFYDLRIAVGLEELRIRRSQITRYVRNAFVIMKRCSPVFVVLFLAMFSLNIPRYFIDLYHEEQIGYFGIIAMPVTLIVLVMTFILQPNVVRLSTLYGKKDYQSFNKLVKRLVTITLLAGVLTLAATIAVGVPVLQFVFGIDFSSYFDALVIIVAGAVANALVGVVINILIIMRYLKIQFYILLLTNILLFVISASVTKEWGLLGGVRLFTAVSFVQAVLFAVAYTVILKRAKYAKKD